MDRNRHIRFGFQSALQCWIVTIDEEVARDFESVCLFLDGDIFESFTKNLAILEIGIFDVLETNVALNHYTHDSAKDEFDAPRRGVVEDFSIQQYLLEVGRIPTRIPFGIFLGGLAKGVEGLVELLLRDLQIVPGVVRGREECGGRTSSHHL